MPFTQEILTDFIAVADSQIIGEGVNARAPQFEAELNGTQYEGLEIQSSFGIGRASRIPWIVFLGRGQRVREGIYPAVLYCRQEQLLIVAYGISERREPRSAWALPDERHTMEAVFAERGLARPAKYRASLVKEVFQIHDGFDGWGEVLASIDEVIRDYRQQELHVPEPNPEFYEVEVPNDGPGEMEEFGIARFLADARGASFYVTTDLASRLATSLISRRFVILTGLAGSGKTKIAIAFSKWMSTSADQVRVVAVGADWTNREPLLGYVNALMANQYVVPENGFLETLVAARDSWDRGERLPFFVILDEMNLSHVERYFADFLSSMESGEAIRLHASYNRLNNIPSSVVIPPNFFVIGTVNVDETTYMFSPKVLDRAHVLEFRITVEELSEMLANHAPLRLEELNGLGGSMAEHFLELSADDEPEIPIPAGIPEVLLQFFAELKGIGAEFGFRSAAEVLRYCRIGAQFADQDEVDWLLDGAILQKLLPKIHGSRRKLEPTLKAMARLCLRPLEGVDQVPVEQYLTSGGVWPDEGLVRFPMTLEKIGRMHRSLLDSGFASFAEA